MSCVSKDKPCGSKDSKIHLVSCTDTHHDVTDLVNYIGWLKIKKIEYLENGTELF